MSLVGNSNFESWYQAHPKANGGDKQLAREAYEAGMRDTSVVSTLLPPVTYPVVVEALEVMSKKYNYPANPANCARYGWEAARKFISDNSQ